MPAGIGGPTTGGAGSGGSGSGGSSFWDGLRWGWYNYKIARDKFRKFRTSERLEEEPYLEEEKRVLSNKTLIEKQRNELEAARDARGKAFKGRADRALKMAIKAGTLGGAITKDSVAIYDSPALRTITTENPFLDPGKRQNLTALREASAHTTKDLRQYTAGTESMQVLNSPSVSNMPGGQALMVSGKMKALNAPTTSMRELNSPTELIKNRPDFTMQRLTTPIKLNRLRNAGNPGSMQNMPITNPPPQPRLQAAINQSVPVFNLQSLRIRDFESGQTPLAREATRNLTIKQPVIEFPSAKDTLRLESTPRQVFTRPKLKLKSGKSDSGFDNSYYKRNMAKFRKELR